MRFPARICVALAVGGVAVGCSSRSSVAPPAVVASTHPSTQPSTQPVSLDDPIRAEPYFWLDQPAVARAQDEDFYKLWEVARQTARGLLFEIDREDYRGGLMTTVPQISPQFFEPWRGDVGTTGGLARSSIATVRRTIYFRFERAEDGAYHVTPKVLIERQSRVEHRITTSVQYREAFGAPPQRTRESDRGLSIPTSYWYSIGRDEVLEKRIAHAVQARLQ